MTEFFPRSFKFRRRIELCLDENPVAQLQCLSGTGVRDDYYLTRCLAKGHVQKFLLKSPANQQAARQATTAFNEFYVGLEELSQINTELLRRGEAIEGSHR